MSDGLLRWAHRLTRGHDNVTPANDFEESWADGLAFCALFYAYFPEKIPMKILKTDTEEDKINNLALAFEVGKEAGIDPLLDPDDTLHYHEKKSIILYLSECYAVLKDLPQKFSASYEWNKKFEAEEQARKFAEWKSKKDAEAKGELFTPQKPTKTGSVAGKWNPDKKPDDDDTPSTPAISSNTPTPSASGRSVSSRWNPKGSPPEEEEEKPKPSITSPRPSFQKEGPNLTNRLTTAARNSSSKISSSSQNIDTAASPTNKLTTAARSSSQISTLSQNSDIAPANDEPTPTSGTLSYEISGRGKDGGNEGKMLIFTVTLKLDGKLLHNAKKEDLVVYVDCPGSPARCSIMGGTGGAYHVGFTPSVGGQFWFDFVWKGIWCSEPFMIPIKNKFNKLPDHPYTGAERKAAGSVAGQNSIETVPSSDSPSSHTKPSEKTPKQKEPSPEYSVCSDRTAEMTDDDYGSFTITAKDENDQILKGDFNFDVKISGPMTVSSKISNNGDGTYTCSFGPVENTGNYVILVSYAGKEIKKGKWDLKITDAMDELLFEDVTILFRATDKNGHPKNVGGDVFQVITTGDEEPEIMDLEDGRYTLEYHVIPGRNSIDVLFKGQSLSGFPLVFEVD